MKYCKRYFCIGATGVENANAYCPHCNNELYTQFEKAVLTAFTMGAENGAGDTHILLVPSFEEALAAARAVK